MPRFLSDEMMGDVASWLRILGLDTLYAKDYERKYHVEAKDVSVKDLDLIAECFAENRILLSRDKEMVKIMQLKYLKLLKENPELWKSYDLASSDKFPFIYLENVDATTRLSKIREYFNLELKFDPLTARCSHCNYSLRKIQNIEDFKEKIPEKAYKTQKEFWICTNDTCTHIYWIGSHFRDILKKINAIQSHD